MTKSTLRRPRVWLVGDYEHVDFREIVALVRNDAEMASARDERICPELVVIAQSRPGVLVDRVVERLRRRAPLAGVVSLLGSWCEGQARASRPTHDTLRLYWYEFARWWQRQLALRAAGLCPDWSRPGGPDIESNLQQLQFSAARSPRLMAKGVIAVATPRWETADVLWGVLQQAGYATVWHSPSRLGPTVRGFSAGVWEGGQLDDREAMELAAFCRSLAHDSAPVVALLDFPRHDRCELARQSGAAAVVAKPWNNADLVATVASQITARKTSRAA